MTINGLCRYNNNKRNIFILILYFLVIGHFPYIYYDIKKSSRGLFKLYYLYTLKRRVQRDILIINNILLYLIQKINSHY